jgi:hypothetical protein
MSPTSVVTRSLTGFAFALVLVSCSGGGSSTTLPLSISTTVLPPGGVSGVTFPGFMFTATGGSPPLTWSEVGTLPPGLVLTSSGLISGTPTTIGTFLITVSVQDSMGQGATPENFTIEIVGFTATGGMQFGREGCTATLLNTGKVLVAGGFNGGTVLTTAELYDPATAAFALTGSMVIPRSGHTATLLSNGKVLVTGGAPLTLGPPPPEAEELYDPATGAFAPTGVILTPRGLDTATLLSDGTVLVVGGNQEAGLNTFPPTLATAELYNPATGTFTQTGSMASPRNRHTATLLVNGKVLVIGGFDGQSALATAEIYDPATRAFTPTGSMAFTRTDHMATLLNNGKILVTGGWSDITVVNSHAVYIGQRAVAELYDPVTGSFTTTGTLETPRSQHAATLRKDGTVLVAGGVMGETMLETAELYNPALATFSPAGSMAVPRYSFTATLLPDGSVLVTSGCSDIFCQLPPLSTAELFQ